MHMAHKKGILLKEVENFNKGDVLIFNEFDYCKNGNFWVAVDNIGNNHIFENKDIHFITNEKGEYLN